jgi:hypothetical protein
LDLADALGKLKKNDNFLYNLLAGHYDVQIVDTPDVIFFAFLYQGQEFPSGKLLPGKLIPFGHTPFGNIEIPTPLGDRLEGI